MRERAHKAEVGGGAGGGGVAAYLRRNPNEQQPLLFGVRAVVDDLTARQAGVPVEDLDRLRVALHAPVVDGAVRHQGNRVERDPLPEGHVVRHGVCLHLALHLNVENLQSLCGCKHGRSQLAGDPEDKHPPTPITAPKNSLKPAEWTERECVPV